METQLITKLSRPRKYFSVPKASPATIPQPAPQRTANRMMGIMAALMEPPWNHRSSSTKVRAYASAMDTAPSHSIRVVWFTFFIVVSS